MHTILVPLQRKNNEKLAASFPNDFPFGSIWGSWINSDQFWKSMLVKEDQKL